MNTVVDVMVQPERLLLPSLWPSPTLDRVIVPQNAPVRAAAADGRELIILSGRGLMTIQLAAPAQHSAFLPQCARMVLSTAAGARRSSEHGRGRGRCMDNVFVERLWRSIKYEEMYLKAYQNGTEARKGIGAYLAFYNQERPHQALGYRSPGQVFQAVSPQRCLLEHPRALPSDEGLRDTPAVDSLILASPLS